MLADPGSLQPIVRPLSSQDIAVFLRALVGLPPWDHAQGADELLDQRSAPAKVDAVAWLRWALAGLHACALPSEDPEGEAHLGPWVPSIRNVMSEARRAAMTLAMERHGGNISHAAKALGTSRRALREHLKAAGLYPWGGVVSEDDDELGDDEGDEPSDDDGETDAS